MNRILISMIIAAALLLFIPSLACSFPAEPAAQDLLAPTRDLNLPIVTRNYPSAVPTQLIQPADIQYVGAFRLPGGEDRPLTFAYGGGAMTYNPQGDPSGPADGYPGSLFIMGHDRMPYGELPNGNQVAEVSIPVPVNSHDLARLNTASFRQSFHDIATGYFTNYSEIPRTAMLYLNTTATGPKIHLAWGQHFQFEPLDATHAWFEPSLAQPKVRGTWYIGNQSLYSVNGYMMEIPAAWADQYASGRYVGTGRYKDGGLSGMGPALFAYRPWTNSSGAPAATGTHLPETTLLLYANAIDTPDIVHSMAKYQHADEWEGGAWLTTATGKTAVLFAGTKSNGTKYWYGYINPAGAQYPCVDAAHVEDFTTCRLANGSPCPSTDFTECSGHTSERGWWSTHFDAQFILYNPADLAKVASGQIPTWQPQPYATLDIDNRLLLNPAGVEQALIGTGDQRRYRVSEMAYDRKNGLLYLLEQFADDTRPIVHVWRVK